MPRVKRGTKRNDRRKKILKRASGYFLTKSKLYQAAQEAVERGLKFAYIGRRLKKRQFRSLWIVRIAAGLQAERDQLFAVHQRTEEGRRRAGPQDSGRHCRARTRPALPSSWSRPRRRNTAAKAESPRRAAGKAKVA